MNERAHCPYLGLRQNRAIRFASPTSEHRCYVTGEGQEIPVDQRQYCLSVDHLTCPLYTGEWSATTAGAVASAGALALPQQGMRGRLSGRDRAFYFAVLGLLATITLVWLGIGYLYTFRGGMLGVLPPTATPTLAPPTATSTLTPTRTIEPSPSRTPTLTATATLTPTPTSTPTETVEPTITPTHTPVVIIIIQTPTSPPLPPPPPATPVPTEAPVPTPTEAPTPTFMPTDTPAPTEAPTTAPTEAPTTAPTEAHVPSDPTPAATTGTSFAPFPTILLPTEFVPTQEPDLLEPSSTAGP